MSQGSPFTSEGGGVWVSDVGNGVGWCYFECRAVAVKVSLEELLGPMVRRVLADGMVRESA